MNDYFDNWTIQLRKGLLEIGILSALKGRERYGYDLVKSLSKSPAWASPKARSTPCSPACESTVGSTPGWWSPAKAPPANTTL